MLEFLRSRKFYNSRNTGVISISLCVFFLLLKPCCSSSYWKEIVKMLSANSVPSGLFPTHFWPLQPVIQCAVSILANIWTHCATGFNQVTRQHAVVQRTFWRQWPDKCVNPSNRKLRVTCISKNELPPQKNTQYSLQKPVFLRKHVTDVYTEDCTRDINASRGQNDLFLYVDTVCTYSYCIALKGKKNLHLWLHHKLVMQNCVYFIKAREPVYLSQYRD
jgi:hypothetical protein